ncbi:transcription antitermination factor NusB [Cutibacterium sp. WCA-380-WT-3A]|uniref:Transcription antitermination protein NusB n=1 Tax=Cutibacterium porci TaxID=2605781 RepID=A0A7K0J6L8_9ACTN|nr:transcription antitermination factor NusB [Cutibacterium porci]MSS45473.1 transcription antitermination factor NusB [Cutibacterium porci]
MSTNSVPSSGDEGPIERIGDLEVRRVSGDIQKHADLSTRSKARKQALDILFEADLMGADPLDVLAARPGVFTNPVRPFAAELVRGVAATQVGLDSVLSDCLSEGWTLARMPRVDRILARLGAFEILHTDTPNEAVISEAIELSEEFSTDDSAPFLNGLLGAVISHGPARTGDEADPSDSSVPEAAVFDDAPASDDDCGQVAIAQVSIGNDNVDAAPSDSDGFLSSTEAANVDTASKNVMESENRVGEIGLVVGEHPASKDQELVTDLDKTDTTSE